VFLTDECPNRSSPFKLRIGSTNFINIGVSSQMQKFEKSNSKCHSKKPTHLYTQCAAYSKTNLMKRDQLSDDIIIAERLIRPYLSDDLIWYENLTKFCSLSS
jgi:hypothetical protein